MEDWVDWYNKHKQLKNLVPNIQTNWKGKKKGISSIPISNRSTYSYLYIRWIPMEKNYSVCINHMRGLEKEIVITK